MTDKELLKLAANSINYLLEDDDDEGLSWTIWGENNCPIKWNPLTDDGDALRLAVKLGLELDPWLYRKITTVIHAGLEENIYEDHGDDPYAATRRAIVRAAAEIGKTL